MWRALCTLALLFPGLLCVNSTVTLRRPVHIYTFHKSSMGSSSLWDWYKYHSNIVGVENIHGIDHNVTDRHAMNSLRKQGFDITPYYGQFKNKRVLLTKEMRKYNDRSAFLVPMDIDEYLVGVTVGPDGQPAFTTDLSFIREAFNKLQVNGFKYKFFGFEGFACDMSETRGSTARTVIRFAQSTVNRCNAKTFYYSVGFVNTDQGNHRGKVARDNNCSSLDGKFYISECDACFHNDTGLALVHYGNPSSLGVEQYTIKARQAAKVYGFDMDNINSADDCRGNGRHYCVFSFLERTKGRREVERLLVMSNKCSHRYMNRDISLYLKSFDTR